MRAAPLALAALVLLAAACSGDDDGVPVLITRTPSPTATVAVAETATATATPSPTDTPVATSTAAPAPTSTATPAPTATPPPSTPGPPPTSTPGPGDTAGLPFSTADVRSAIEGAEVTFLEYDEGAMVCPGTGVPAQLYWTAGGATDFGPVFALWVYPDEDTLAADWDVTPGERPISRLEGCEDVGSGFVYWNANLVMAFALWLSAGVELPLEGHGDLPNEFHAGRSAIDAFLELTP